MGAEKQHFTAHEEALARSPRLKLLCTKQTTKKGNSKLRPSLVFPLEDPNSFGHLLEYLYLNIVFIPASESLVEARQLADLFSVARTFELGELQEDIISRLESSGISSRVSAMEFISLAEDLFSGGMVKGLQSYFAKEAPSLMKTLSDDHFLEVECMIAEGGDFAQALFSAYREAFRLKNREEAKENLSRGNDADVETSVKIDMEPETKDELWEI